MFLFSSSCSCIFSWGQRTKKYQNWNLIGPFFPLVWTTTNQRQKLIIYLASGLYCALLLRDLHRRLLGCCYCNPPGHTHMLYWIQYTKVRIVVCHYTYDDKHQQTSTGINRHQQVSTGINRIRLEPGGNTMKFILCSIYASCGLSSSGRVVGVSYFNFGTTSAGNWQ